MCLRPRRRPRKDVVGAIVAVDQTNSGGNSGNGSGGVMPAAKIHLEPRGNSLAAQAR